MLANVPPPPAPSSVALTAVAVGCLLVSAALLLWGRSAGRGLLALMVAAVAAAASQLLTPYFSETRAWIIGTAGGVTGFFVGLLLARVIWAVILAALVSAAGLVVVGFMLAGAVAQPPAWGEGELVTLAAWSVHFLGYLSSWVWALLQHNWLAVAAGGGAPLVAAVAAGVFLPRTVTVLCSCLIGAAGIVSAVAMILWAYSPALLEGWGRQIYLPLIVAGALAVGGLYLQGRVELRKAAQARARKKEKKAAESEAAAPKA